MLNSSYIDSLPMILGKFPDGAVLHYYSDVTVTVSKIDNTSLYNVIAFTRYGEIIDCLSSRNYIDILKIILGKWGYPMNGWRPLISFCIQIGERPADCSPPNGIRWLEAHPTKLHD